ncbi:signal transduction protein [Enterovibrio coralii]|uniref:Signal transduction protein n=2 Tax=Enterovibrio coralii TaxID=294935 RepID=A0A135I988_9GAMM|nr:signal transduction protein [Enterovibrio coralii]
MFSKKLHWFIVVIGTVAAISSGFAVNYLDAQRHQNAFETLVEQRLKALEKALFSFNELQLSAQLYFQNSYSLDKIKFQQFLQSRTRKGSGIHSVFWLPKVRRESVQTFETSVVRNEGSSYDTYQIYPQATEKCAWSLTEYTFPVLYVSPQTHAEKYIGWRAESQCEFAHAMERAFFQRRPEASFFHKENGNGVRLFSAVLEKDVLKGYLVTSIYFESFFAAVWPDYKELDNLHINVRPQFSAPHNAAEVLFQSGVLNPDNYMEIQPVRQLVRIPGSEEGVWIEFTQTDSYLTGYQYSLLVTVLGMLLTFATAACVWSYSSRLALANELVSRQTKKLRYQAYHDNLTSLSNRLSLEKRLKEEQTHLQSGVSLGFSILFIDLDRFKHVNDSLGHLVGDKLLQAVADRIFISTPTEHRSYRFGGDEFVVCLSGVILKDKAYSLAQAYLDALNQQYMIDGHTIQIGASIGISTITDHRFTLLDIIQQADIAMYHAKEQGNAITFYSEEMLTEVQQRFNIEQELAYALTDEQFTLAFQPVFKGDDVHFFEALIRWNHPYLGPISPLQFIPIAEETNQIHSIGRWVLQEVCALLESWQKEANSLDYPGISVNVSAKQLGSPAFISFVKDLLNQHHIPPHKLGIEITETTLMEDEVASAASLSALRAAGITLYLDDFGTGYSSLSLLGQHKFDVLKIDRNFLVDVADDQKRSSKLCAAIVNLSKSLDMDVVAEGIETENQLTWINAQGSVYIQGYLKSKPLPIEQLIHWHPSCIAPQTVFENPVEPTPLPPITFKPANGQA